MSYHADSAAALEASATQAVHAGRHGLVDRGHHAVPLDLSTTYPARDSREEARRLDVYATGELLEGTPIYGRVSNETAHRFETAMAELEGCEAAVAFATGMAALTACLLSIAAQGRPHVVAVRPLYGTTDHLLASGLLGTEVTYAAPDEVAAALTSRTGLVMLETPANPTLREVDIAALAHACGSVPLLVDNTFATPVLQRPAMLGAAVVLHSATKFIGGHGDTFGGVVACAESFARQLRQVRYATGSILHPWAAYLLLRGLPTLPLRVTRSSATAAELATRLAGHPLVRQVHYPGLAADRPAKQMAGGGALVAFETTGEAEAVVGAVRLITPAVSLGSVDSLLQHPASLTHRIMGEQERAAAGVNPDLLRLSVGLENVEDLWADLDKALHNAP